jgi:Family of unknown function (DUF6763)
MASLFPIIGTWYQSNHGDIFEVVAVDEVGMTIEIQYFDGAIEGIELENWQSLRVREVAQPEDWSGSLDIEREDYGVDLEESAMVDEWASPLDLLDRAD